MYSTNKLTYVTIRMKRWSSNACQCLAQNNTDSIHNNSYIYNVTYVSPLHTITAIKVQSYGNV